MDARLQPHHYTCSAVVRQKDMPRRRQRRWDPVPAHPLGFSKYDMDISDADRHDNWFQCNLSGIELVDISLQQMLCVLIRDNKLLGIEFILPGR